MNQQLRSRDLSQTTQAAEGLARRRFTVAEIEAMVEAGILQEGERFELIGGELVPMSPKGIRHELLKTTLNRYWAKLCPDDLYFAQETTFRLDEASFVEPDFVFYRKSDGLAELKPATALLAVEIADTSLSYDLGRKTRIYATFGIREVWVMNAITLETRVHTRPGVDGYEDVRNFAAGDVIAPAFCPELAVVLGALELR